MWSQKGAQYQFIQFMSDSATSADAAVVVRQNRYVVPRVEETITSAGCKLNDFDCYNHKNLADVRSTQWSKYWAVSDACVRAGAAH